MLWSERAEILALFGQVLEPALAHLGELLGRTFLIVAGALLLIVAIDVPFQIWDHRQQLRMTKEEVRQEKKETEGDPQSRHASAACSARPARRRMMAEVPKADVIVTNPTHYAVALRYREERWARQGGGQGLRWSPAHRRLGQATRVPMLELRPWRGPVRARRAGPGDPAALYTAVAEVLAYVYQLRRAQAGGGRRRRRRSIVPVPGP